MTDWILANRNRTGLTADLRRPLRSGIAVLFLLAGALGQDQHVWKIETVNSTPGSDVGAFASLVIDQASSFHVGYYDSTHASLLYSFRGRNDKQWFTTTVDNKGRGSYVSLAVDTSGMPHFAYGSHYEDGLHYAVWDGQRWQKQLIDPERIDYYTSIQLDKQGRPRISYYLYHGPDSSYILHLKFASFDGKKWTIETVDQRRGTGKFNSLALDASGNPLIAYTHVGLGDLLFAAWDGSRWNFGDADSRQVHNDYVGTGNSIVVDHSDNPQIAYFDYTKHFVKFAFRQNGRWKSEIVDTLVNQGEVDHVSLKLDSHDRPRIAYYDGGMGILKYATREEKGWHIEVVDNNGNVGKYPSLCLDRDERPYIAYEGLDTGALYMAHLETTSPVTVARKK